MSVDGVGEKARAAGARIAEILGGIGRAKELVAWLPKTDFYSAPASSRYHLAVPGGLAVHSLNVYERLMAKRGQGYGIERMPVESLQVAALLHDLCKIATYDLTSNGWRRNERFVYGHGEKSVWIAERRMRLTPEEALAIRWHMGAYEGGRAWSDVSKVFGSCPLAFALHMSDMEAAYVDDVRGVPPEGASAGR